MSNQPLSVSHSLLINHDSSWKVYVQGRVVGKTNKQLSTIPDYLDSSSLQLLISTIDSAKICPGQPNPRYSEMARDGKGVFTGANGQVKATLETSFPVVDSKGEVFSSTIRMAECDLLSDSGSHMAKSFKPFTVVLLKQPLLLHQASLLIIGTCLPLRKL